MWMSVLKALQSVLICVITSMVATIVVVQAQAIDYRVITLPVKVSFNQMGYQFRVI